MRHLGYLVIRPRWVSDPEWADCGRVPRSRTSVLREISAVLWLPKRPVSVRAKILESQEKS